MAPIQRFGLYDSLAETGSVRRVVMEVNLVFTTFTPALGLAECADTHTVHFAESYLSRDGAQQRPGPTKVSALSKSPLQTSLWIAVEHRVFFESIP
jgi:hypothetical protein